MSDKSGLRLVELDEDGVDTSFRADVLAGLQQPQKAVPARWFYDTRGSALFEDITKVEEYYPTRAETEILRNRGSEFAELIGEDRAVVEFGSGSSVKTPLLLSAIKPRAYVPLDISGEFLRAAASDLSGKFPDLPVHPIEADFTKRVELPSEVGAMPKLGFFPGSTIGNMIPRSAVDLLREMRVTLGEGALLLIGMDQIKDRAVLEAAYDDAAGVTAAFNLNLLTRINRELSGTIPVDQFRHEARWNDNFARVEMHLVAQSNVSFEVSGQTFSMQEGETIHTENSHKYGKRSGNTLLLAGHWTPIKRWTDDENRFAMVLARATVARSAP